MKWNRKEMVAWPDGKTSFSEEVTFEKNAFEKNDRLNDLKDIMVKGEAHYDDVNSCVYVNYTVSGIMIVPCSITLEDVDYSFVANDTETFSFIKGDEDADFTYIKGDVVDLFPSIFQLIMMEVPWNVHKPGLKEMPKGDGWEVVSESGLTKQDSGVNPRLAKILEFKPEKD